MVDINKRKRLALHLRHLSVGLLSNDDFENDLMNDVTNGWLPEQYHRAKEAKSDDPIIQPILELCWGLYSDTRSYKLINKDRLSEQSLKIIARCILFLQTDREYQWPGFENTNPLIKFSLAEIVQCILSLGGYYIVKRKEQKLAFSEFQKLGNFEIWPFLKQEDYDEQLKIQPFLIGKS
ncbi:hypothetical protein [Pedobacter sp. NJ-S-72]